MIAGAGRPNRLCGLDRWIQHSCCSRSLSVLHPSVEPAPGTGHTSAERSCFDVGPAGRSRLADCGHSHVRFDVSQVPVEFLNACSGQQHLTRRSSCPWTTRKAKSKLGGGIGPRVILTRRYGTVLRQTSSSSIGKEEFPRQTSKRNRVHTILTSSLIEHALECFRVAPPENPHGAYP